MTWHALLPGTDPRKPVNRNAELRKLRDKYLPRSLAGTPWSVDIFDEFLDHSLVKLSCPA